MTSWLEILIQKERERRVKVERFIAAVKPFMETLHDRAHNLIQSFTKAFPDMREQFSVILSDDRLFLQVQRLSTGQNCRIETDLVRYRLSLIFSNKVREPVTVAINDAGTLELVALDPSIDGFLRAVLAPLFFPELLQSGVSLVSLGLADFGGSEAD